MLLSARVMFIPPGRAALGLLASRRRRIAYRIKHGRDGAKSAKITAHMYRFVRFVDGFFRCPGCRRSRRELLMLGIVRHVDHIMPWAGGYLTVLWNLMALCATCNLAKSNYSRDKDGYEHYNSRLRSPVAVSRAAAIQTAEFRHRRSPVRWVMVLLALLVVALPEDQPDLPGVSLTRKQALAAALVLAYADAGAAPAGGTIAQGAAAAQAAAKGAGGGSQGPKHVATAKGAAHFHAGIGGLIIPHHFGPPGQEHYAAGAPGHMIHNVSEAKWIANQWKDHGKAKEAAEKAVAAGTHHWVQAGEHTYAVHNGLEVHVPKDVDIHNPAEVKNAPKVIVKHGPEPEHLTLHHQTKGGNEPQPTTDFAKDQLEQHYKKLPPEPAKKAVTVGGKHAAWVPHDWEVHKEADIPEAQVAGKYAKDPQGHWHLIDKSGKVEPVPDYNASAMQDWKAKGGIVPEENHPGPEPQHVAPNQAAEGHEPATAEIGGVAVTKDQIHDAIAKLEGSTSTQIKGLLKGHPLEASDYHAVFKAELEAHPELKVPSGTKKQHASPAKLAFIHHLAGQADKLAADEAHAQAAKLAAEKAEAQAKHAQELTPGTYEVGGVHVTAQEIQQAIAKLEGSASTQIKGLLKGNPLAGSDYWAVVNAYKADHPAEFGKGTKQAHVAKAKPLFVAALKELSAHAATGEVQSGHDVAAQIHEDLMGKHIKDGWNQSSNGAIVKALIASAGAQGSTRYAYLGPQPGTWIGGSLFPKAGQAYYEVTPEHKVILHLSDGTVMPPWPADQVAEAVKQWTTDSPPAPEPKSEPAPAPKLPKLQAKAKPEPAFTEPEPEPAPQPILDTKAWKATPEYAAVHDVIEAPGSGQQPLGNTLDTHQQLAMALYLSAKNGITNYLYPGQGAQWKINSHLPSGIAGTFGIPGQAYYQVTPDHEIIAYGNDGQGFAVPGETVKEIAEKHLAPPPPPEPEKPPEPPEPPAEQGTGFEVTAGGHAMQAPAGSQVYVSKYHPDISPGSDWADVKYVKAPDGTWSYVQKSGHGVMAPGTEHGLNGEVKSGQMVPWPPMEPAPAAAAVPEPEKPPAPEPEPAKPEPPAGTAALKDLLINGAIAVSSDKGGKANADWALAFVMKSVAKNGQEKWLIKQWNDTWQSQNYAPGTTFSEFYHISGDLAVTHHAGGADTVLSPEKLSQITAEMVVPDSVKLQNPVTGDYQMFKHGFYYKTSKGAKAYLEIAPWEPGQLYAGAGGKYIYHAPSGDKQVNGSYAAKVLQDATDYHAQAKGTPDLAAKKVSWATAVKPESYTLWSDVTHGPSPEHSADVHGDGSVLLKGPGGNTPLPVTDAGSPADALIQGGALLDSYGTSVVKPGVAMDKYHVFGSEAKTPQQLADLLGQFEQNHGDLHELVDLIKTTWGDQGLMKNLTEFFGAKNAAGDWQGQRDAIMSLLRELLKVPDQPAGAGALAGEVKFLKGLPPGIAKAEDVFTWTDKGYAKPQVITFTPYATATELTATIKKVSEQFGGGKVVGTHPSSLAKDQKLAWLNAWQHGDMATIFALDASGGKVSPAHPGAPGNAATHHVTWSPWDESQVPAGQVIEGNWSDLSVQPSKAEADNYLIKAGLKHAAFLSLAERRSFVKRHRNQDQQSVDVLSKTAADRFSGGEQPLSEPPVWSDSFAPAKSYTLFLEDGTPAESWTSQAAQDFANEHQAELIPFAQQLIDEQGSSLTAQEWLNQSGYYSRMAIGRWQEAKAAAELAEKLRPKYALVPGEPGQVTDQYGHKFAWHPGGGKAAKQRLAVAELAKAWGMKTPRVQQVQLEADGTKGTVTDLLDHKGTLAGLTPQGMKLLSAKELGDIAREHVFDHALANPSSTPGDYVRSGGGIIGTGKAGAFSDTSWNGTDLAHLNDVAKQPVSQLFDAISQGWVGQAQADAAYTAAIRSARRMSAIKDSRLAEALNGAGVPMDSQLEMFQRVANLPDSVQGLWDSVYKQQGWTPPEVPLAKLPHGLHSGFSEPEFFDHVMAAKSSGVPAFFAGPHLEDGNFHVWTEKAGENRYVRGESSLRGKAMDAAVKWAQQNVTGGEPQPEPAAESPVAVVKGLASWYPKIIGAAKAVSLHAADQNWEGNWTKAKLDNLASLKTELTDLVKGAEEVQAASGNATGQTAEVVANYEKTYGPPDHVKQAAQYYLAQIAKIEEHKANALTFSPGDLPEWKAPPPPEKKALPKPDPPKGVKVEYLKATRVLSSTQATKNSAPSGIAHGADGELGLGKAIYEYPGYAWHITLPTGEVIEISNEGKSSTPSGQYGRIRFRAIASDGSASMERIRSHLQEMGVPLDEATPEDMELLYWRSLAGVLGDRGDRNDGKHAQVWATLDKAVPAAANVTSAEGAKVRKVIDAGLDPAKELELWHKAWANLTSPEQVQQWVDKSGHMPHLPHLNVAAADVPAGKPYWYRFDADPAWLAKQQLPTHSLSNKQHLTNIAATGGLYSTEGRLRALGLWISGSSSTADMQSHGSAGVVYTRPAQESSTYHHIFMSPRVQARTSTYGFGWDAYGDISKRKNPNPGAYGGGSHFDLAKMISKDTTEHDIKDVVSMLDDIMLVNAGEYRDEVIKALKDRGVTEIRGMKVEDRILSSVSAKDIAKAKAAEPDPETWFNHPEEPWSPPVSEAVTKEHSVVESAAEKAASVEATPADALKNALYGTDHSIGAAPEAVSQVFYQAPSKPSSVMSDAPKLKGAVAQRVAAKMTSSEEQMQALADAAGLNPPASWGPDTKSRVAAALVGSWAQSNSSPVALALQNVAHTTFGIAKDALPGLGYTDASSEQAAAQLEEGFGAVLADFLQAQWAETQADLAAGGVEHMTLYRVFHFSNVPAWAKDVSAGNVIDAPQARPLSSWGFLQGSAEAAGTFTSGGKTVVVKTTVPASMALSYPRTGFGCYNETEFVILDAPGQWEIVKVSG